MVEFFSHKIESLEQKISDFEMDLKTQVKSLKTHIDMQKYQANTNHRQIEQFNKTLDHMGDETHQIKQITEKLQVETGEKINDLSKLWTARTDNLDDIIKYVDQAKGIFEKGSDSI
jgi:chromosome segregation ATPase